jgi:L-serine dehydratase
MDTLSLFDVLGPIMVGPSSSHTAGAVRIGWLARHVAGRAPVRITLGFHENLMQTYKGHATDSGLVAGLLGYREYDERVRTALQEARRRDISVDVQRLNRPGHPNEMQCDLVLDDGSRTRISGISVGGGNILLSGIDGAEIKIDGRAGGVLIRHTSALLPEAVLAHLAGNGFWADSLSAGKGPDISVTFIPGPVPPDESFLRRIEELWAEEGVTRCQWIPGLEDQLIPPSARQVLFATGEDLLCVTSGGASVPEAAVRYETGLTGQTPDHVRSRMAHVLSVMREAVRNGLEKNMPLFGGFASSEDAKSVWRHADSALGGPVLSKAIAMALAVAEVNASQGRIVACPTAGACGVVAGLTITVGEHVAAGEDALIDSLLVAAALGTIIGRTASFSGAVGGCQAEIGIAAAMAAGTATYLGGGNAEEVLNAAAMAMKNMLGLVCDPAAGPVEVPCIKRNAGGVAIALAAAEMALAGVQSAIPFDEVVLALKNVQDLLHEDLRDNTRGGLGCTPTSARMKAEWARRCQHMCE